MPNTFVNVTAKSLSVGHGSQDISYYLVRFYSKCVALVFLFGQGEEQGPSK